MTTITTGTLYIISAPSGGGKTSLVSALLESVANLEVSVSHTTRLPRPGENNGVDYYFVDEQTFEQAIAKNAFIEYAKVFGNYYGTSQAWVKQKLQAGIDIILEIDWQGAKQVRSIMPEAIGIFILPPTWEVLEKRLRQRAQDSEEVINKRMAQAQDEMSHYHEYDYLIVNDNFAKALADLNAIIHVRRLRLPIQKIEQSHLLEKLRLEA